MVKDRFPPDDRIPLFLSDLGEEPEQSGIRKVVSSEIFRKIVLAFTAAAIVFAIVSVGNLILFASVTASLVSTTAPQDGSGQSAPAIQSTGSAEALSRTAPGDDLLAAFKSSFESKTEVAQPRAEALVNQFQAWAAKEDVQAQVQPPQPVQDARAHIAQKAPLPKPRPIHAEQTVRAQDSAPQNARSPMRIFGWRN
jgi:hypothetical protein